MANTTSFFDLILPGFGEYRDSWWDPINSNFTTIDTWSQSIDLEIVAARFSKTSLSEFLAVGHETDGNLKATPEVTAAHISPIYGFQTPEPALFDLTTRVSQVEWEMWYSREGNADLRRALAARMPGIKNQILEGAKDGNGHPAWLGYSGGTSLHVDGSSTPLWVSIDGRLGRVRTDHTLTVSGAAGTRYLYAQYLEDGVEGKIVVDGRLTVPLGTTSFDVNNYPIYFNDASRDYTALDVEVGDILSLIDSADIGNYVVKTVAPDLTLTQLEIVGQFPTGGVSTINYTISDPLKMTLGLDTAEEDPLPTGKFYIGEVDFDGSAITEVRPRQYRDTYVSEWREIGVSIIPIFEEIFEHNLGTDLLDVSVQVSTADDGTAPIEELSLTSITRNYVLSLTKGTLAALLSNTLSFNQGTLPQFTQGTFNPGTSDATHAADQLNPGSLPSLSGTVALTPQGADVSGISGAPAGSLTGDVYTDSSVKVQWTKSKLWVKNAESGKFYKGYSGTTNTAGFLRVIVRKRG